MDTQPILSLIREEALQAAESARAQALERAKVIREESLRSSARMFESAKEDAAHEAEQARDRLRRLRELEDRKYALSARRELIGKAFDEALRKLHVLGQGEMAELMLSLIAANAQGVESLQAGDINDGFYTPAFIQRANQKLAELGRPGRLKDAGGRAAGCCGVVLASPESRTYCTVEALMESGREGLEQKAAALLFDNEAS